MTTALALLFPTGGAHWPGMGADLEGVEPYGEWLEQADGALRGHDVPSGELGRLMAGERQAGRRFVDGAWQWTGDFPLSVAAQTLLGCCLADTFVRAHGEPRAVLGESMGECAALGATGALRVRDAVVLAHRWASALASASDRLALRMAVVEGLERAALERLALELDAAIVVEESRTLFVISLPRSRLDALQTALGELPSSRMLVSANPCVAHDPRLGAIEEVWRPYADFVRELEIARPRRQLYSALHPGKPLETASDVRADLLETSFVPVRWREAVTHLCSLGVSHLVAVGVAARPYGLDKLRAEEPDLGLARARALRDLHAARRLIERDATGI